MFPFSSKRGSFSVKPSSFVVSKSAFSFKASISEDLVDISSCELFELLFKSFDTALTTTVLDTLALAKFEVSITEFDIKEAIRIPERNFRFFFICYLRKIYINFQKIL